MALSGTSSSFLASTAGFFETKQTKHTHIMLEGQPVFVHEKQVQHAVTCAVQH